MAHPIHLLEAIAAGTMDGVVQQFELLRIFGVEFSSTFAFTFVPYARICSICLLSNLTKLIRGVNLNIIVPSLQS